MKKILFTKLVLAVCLISFSAGFAQTVDDLILMTEDYPPNNFEENGKVTGISVDLMELMLKKLNSKRTRDDIRILPWANAYNKTLTKKNTVLFGTSRTPERENLFKWAGPFIPVKNVLIARKESGIKIRSADELKNYRIGAIRDDIGEQLLIQAGVDKKAVERVSKARILIKMLNSGRIDMWSYCENVAKWLFHKNGFQPDDYETVWVLAEVYDYYAFHKDMPDALVQQFQNALDEIKKKPEDGGKSEYEKILDNYLR